MPLLSLSFGHSHIEHSHFEHGHEIHEFIFHQALILFILPVSIIALVGGFRSHRQLTPIITAGIGLVILSTVALFAEDLIHAGFMPHEGETILTVIGGIIHAIGHVMNLLATRKLHSCVAEN